MPSFLSIPLDFLPLLPTVGLSVIAIVALLLYLRESSENQKLHKNARWSLEAKSFDVLHDAIKKAQAIIGSGELEALKVNAESKLRTKRFEERSVASVNQAQEDFKRYLENLTSYADASVGKSDAVVKERINKVLEAFEQNLSSYLTETQAQSSRAIELEMRSARQLIETYKTEQFNLVDENIVAMLERTLSLVLVKKLSLKDQVNLVYESLEKAKAEKFLA